MIQELKLRYNVRKGEKLVIFYVDHYLQYRAWIDEYTYKPEL